MTAALEVIPAKTKLLSIEGAGHELLSKRNEHVLPKMVAETFGQFFSN